MYSEEARQLLSKPLLARLATLSANGYPHVVPVWFIMDGDDVVFIAERSTRKVKNIALSSKAAVVVGGEFGDPTYMIQGDLYLQEDPGFEWMKRITRFYEPAEKAEIDIAAWSLTDMIILRLKPNKVIKAV